VVKELTEMERSEYWGAVRVPGRDGPSLSAARPLITMRITRVAPDSGCVNTIEWHYRALQRKNDAWTCWARASTASAILDATSAVSYR
jgi:hypothetical protein